MPAVSIVTRSVAGSAIDLAACKLGTGVVTCDTVVAVANADAAAADGGTRADGVDDEYPYESDAYDDAGVVDANGRLSIIYGRDVPTNGDQK